ncbi:hypothetical protein HPP92_024391 [Vanilla planifolia]|uniref:SBP-type domain-containing protein n=1 Tax=Vanilla planifolia TaxID=51239 RepID=A0A835PSQ2_VANPL|nr:hypothetical protein HPP92_024391 [Vanilla planifolia]
MDWDSKMPPWDFPEMEQTAAGDHLSSVVGSSSGECSVDLKLGGLGDSEAAEKWKEERRASSAVSSSKRPRAPSSSNQSVSCLVDDCKSDLSGCREYHRRHKVCELHSKTPVVMVGGQEQRFCQQCSRFHLLVEFDEVKRSCRKRLDGHNRRRRKPQQESISTGNLLSDSHGSRFTFYPQNFPTASTGMTWTRSEEEVLYGQRPPAPIPYVEPPQLFTNSLSQTFKESKQLSFLHSSSDMALDPATVSHPLLRTNSPTLECSNSNKMIFSEGSTRVLESNCALSLLSSPAQASGTNLAHVVPSPLLHNLQCGAGAGQYSPFQAASGNVSTTGFSCSGLRDEHVGMVLVPDAGETDLSIFQVEDEGPSDGYF